VAAILKDVAEDQALNAVAAVKGGVRDFLKTSRYFKLRAAVVGVWLAAALAGGAITFRDTGPRSEERLGARVKISPDTEHPAYMFVNDSETAWQNVMVIVNGQWRTVVARVDPGGDFTVTPKQLFGKEGTAAPSNLRATDIVLKAKQGEAVLMKAGQLSE
jgi:hypothetical protein